MVVLEEDALLARHEHHRVVRAEVVAVQVENPLLDAHRACGVGGVEGVEGVVSGDLHGLDGVDDRRGVGEGGFGRGLVEAVDGEREQTALALGREEADEGVGALEELSGGDVGCAEAEEGGAASRAGAAEVAADDRHLVAACRVAFGGVTDRTSGGRKGTLMALEVWIPAETENTATSAKDSSSVQITSVAFFRHTASGAPFSDTACCPRRGSLP